MTQRALLSEKSIPSDARPRQTANRRPPLAEKYGEFVVVTSVAEALRLNMAFTRLAVADSGLTSFNVPFASRNRSTREPNQSKFFSVNAKFLPIVF